MIPTETWRYIVARVRQAYPETLFLLEGLGGKIEVTDELLTEANLDWAYSEIFQEEDRRALERYLPDAIARSQTIGPLIHFAETHDNNRLAARGPVHARMRTALAALLSQSGAFGITNGVEWLATEKINVHGATDLRWNAPDNQVEAIARLNRLLARHPAFGFGATVELVQRGGGNVVVARRTAPQGKTLLVVANLEPATPIPPNGPPGPTRPAWDLLTGKRSPPAPRHATLDLRPGEVLPHHATDLACCTPERRWKPRAGTNLLRRRYCSPCPSAKHGRDSQPARFSTACEPSAAIPRPMCLRADAATGRRPAEANRMLAPAITWQWPRICTVVMLPRFRCWSRQRPSTSLWRMTASSTSIASAG